MSVEIIAYLKSELSKFETAINPAKKIVENDLKAIGSSALNYIETNGLQDAYQIALTVVGAAAAGTPWTATLATIAAQAFTAGKSLEQGAIAVVAAQAQADLIAAGSLLPPVAKAS